MNEKLYTKKQLAELPTIRDLCISKRLTEIASEHFKSIREGSLDRGPGSTLQEKFAKHLKDSRKKQKK